MNQRNLIKALGLNRDGKIKDYSYVMLSDDVPSASQQLRKVREEEALDARKGDMYVQLIYRRNTKKK